MNEEQFWRESYGNENYPGFAPHASIKCKYVLTQYDTKYLINFIFF